jgi:hypothetical protein
MTRKEVANEKLGDAIPLIDESLKLRVGYYSDNIVDSNK